MGRDSSRWCPQVTTSVKVFGLVSPSFFFFFLFLNPKISKESPSFKSGAGSGFLSTHWAIAPGQAWVFKLFGLWQQPMVQL